MNQYKLNDVMIKRQPFELLFNEVAISNARLRVAGHYDPAVLEAAAILIVHSHGWLTDEFVGECTRVANENAAKIETEKKISSK